MNERLRYANLYWRYGAKEVQFDSDLEELVRSAHYRADDGEGTVGTFRQWVDDHWVEIHHDDVRLIEDIIQGEQDALEADAKANAATRPYRVWVEGPGGVWEWWTDADSVENAEAAIDRLAPMHAVYRTDGMRPR